MQGWNNGCNQAGCNEISGNAVVIFIDGINYSNRANSICPNCNVSANFVVSYVQPQSSYGTVNVETFFGEYGIGVTVASTGSTERPSDATRSITGYLVVSVSDGTHTISQSLPVDAVSQYICQVDNWSGC